MIVTIKFIDEYFLITSDDYGRPIERITNNFDEMTFILRRIFDVPSPYSGEKNWLIMAQN